MNDPRQNALSELFITGTATIAGLQCRPFSLGTLTAARILGLSQVVGAQDGPCKEWPMERQMAVLLFLQSQPLTDVQELVRLARIDLDGFDAHVLEFELGIPLSAISEIASQLDKDCGAVGDAQVEIESKPGERSEAEPPNS